MEPLLCRGGASAVVAHKLGRSLLDSFENMNEDIELSEGSSAIVMDCITIWRCIVAISSATLDRDTSEEDMIAFATAVSAVMESANVSSSRNIKAMVGRILMTNEYWHEEFTEFVNTREAWRDLNPKMPP